MKHTFTSHQIDSALDAGKLLVKLSTGWHAARRMVDTKETHDGGWYVTTRVKVRTRVVFMSGQATHEFRIVGSE